MDNTGNKGKKSDRIASPTDREDVLISQVPASGNISTDMPGREEYTAGQEGLARGTPHETLPSYDPSSSSEWSADREVSKGDPNKS